MQLRLLTRWIGGVGLVLGLEACVVHDTPPVNPGYGDNFGYGSRGTASASVSVGEPSPYTVSGLPPEPLYEQMSGSPGDGSVWIDGYWHWNGYEWVWVNGRWEREQPGYVYVEPNYDYQGEQYVYTPGYWSQPERVPRGWDVRDHRDGRPRRVAPPARHGAYRPPVQVIRPPGRPARTPVANPGGGGHIYIPPGGPARPQRPSYYDPNGGGTWRPAPPPGPVIGSDAPNHGPAGGAIEPAPAGGPIHGGAWRPAPTQPSSAPTQPPPGPIYVNPSGPGGGVARPAPPMGRPIYVNPSGPSPAGSYRPPPPAQPGGPIYVNPSGPSAPAPAPNAPAAGGGGYRPAPGHSGTGHAPAQPGQPAPPTGGTRAPPPPRGNASRPQ